MNVLAARSEQIAHWNESLARIIDSDYDNAVLQELVSALERLVDGESSSIIVYPQGQMPFVPYHRLLATEDPAVQIDQYIAGAYLVDPCYLFAREQASEGFCTTADVAPDGFEASEYYKIYYHATDLKDEAFFALQSLEGSVVLVSLGRHSHAPLFVPEEKALLQTLFPVVKVIINKWMRAQHSGEPSQGIERELDLALENFGASLLTQRERVIINLLLRGHSIKSIAVKLENSIETIRHHRKNIYRKLDISSQAELFHLFIDSLRNYVPELNKDPLIAYMSL